MRIHTSEISASGIAEGRPVLPLPMGAQGCVQRSLAQGTVMPPCPSCVWHEPASGSIDPRGTSWYLLASSCPQALPLLTGQPCLGGAAFVPEQFVLRAR